MLLHLGAFVLSNSKQIMDNLCTQSMDFTQMMFNTRTPIHYTFENKLWEKIDKAGLVDLDRIGYKEKTIMEAVVFGTVYF